MTNVDFRQVLHQAASDTAKVMTSQLRSECMASGWPPQIANQMSVKYSGNKLVVDIPESIKTDADTLEYGSPSVQLTAAIRRFGNRPEMGESFLLKRTAQLLKGKL
jgi:hypothetical protein